VKPRQGGEYGASLLSRSAETPDELGPDYSESKDASDSEQPVRGGARAGRASRGAVNGGSSLKKRKRINDDDDDEGSLDDMSDDAPPSGEEWDSQANDDGDDAMPDADDEDSELLDDEDSEPKRLVVTLKTNGKAHENGSSPVVEVKSMEGAAAAGALKLESTAAAATDGAQPTTTTHLQVQDADTKQTEYPTPTSTVNATAVVDKPLAATALKPHPAEEMQKDEMVTEV